ncbi:MAG: universal stress protein [Nitrospirae bacterium]|nr:universal stress protein [Nitrospirota bacterium]
MKKVIRKIGDTMAAAAFAEAGEFETAREIHKGQKTVLLAISDSLFDRSALKYALNVSQRTNAVLEVLYVTPFERERVNLNNFLSEVKTEGFRFSLVMKIGCVKQAILDYTYKRSEILFVIVGSKFELEVECKGGERKLSDAWKKLKCPLVVVSKNEAPLPA